MKNMEKIHNLLQVGTDALRICFDKYFPQEKLEKTLREKKTDMRRGQYRFNESQLEILFPPQDGSNTGVSSLSMDITIMYKLLRIYSDIPPPWNGWGKEPKVEDITESHDIERIRWHRNMLAHSTRSYLEDDDFIEIWTDLSQAILRLSNGVLKRRIAEIDHLTRSKSEKGKQLENETYEDTPVYHNQKKNIDELKEFLKMGKTTIAHARGILIGCGEAGKTTLLKRLTGQYQNLRKDTESTRGLEVHKHLFFVRNGRLEVVDDASPLKAFIRINTADLKPDPSGAVGRSDSIIKTGNLKSKNTDKEKEEVIYSREEKKESREEKTDENTVEIMARNLSSEKDDIFQKILTEKEKLPTVSMLDFAGQFEYYACHQIYITPKAFFILVLDMTKRLDDVLKKEEDKHERTFFSLWTYKDYLRFWITSIKTFGGTEAPVFLIATHSESKSSDEIEKYFEEFWTAVSEEDIEWLSDSVNDREYAVGLEKLNDTTKESLELMKKSIVELFADDTNTKIDLPSSWALMEQILMDGEWKVLSLDEIWKLNSSLPYEFRIKSEKEMSTFLKCFHDNGLLLYYEEENLRGHVVLDIQWFANAFSKIIADANHINRDCRRKCLKDWRSFNKTGELKDKLVDALWKDEPSYKKHKYEMMLYMEKLQMLVPWTSSEAGSQAWYVPCMNKKEFKPDFSEKEKEFSPILCFRFASFAMFVFYRLVAHCISTLRWSVEEKRDNEGIFSCLYQTAAIFDHKGHTVVVGICGYDIQVQVLRIKSLGINKEVSIEVGDSIENALEKLTDTFTDKKSFHSGFKCLNIICKEDDLSFYPARELSEIKLEKTQCKCDLQEKHVLDVKKTLGFWMKDLKSKEIENMKTRHVSLGSEESRVYAMLTNIGPTYPFSKGAIQREVMTSEIKVEVSRSVGLIYIDGHPSGTGFRVGNDLIITCLHVIQGALTARPHFIDSTRVYIQFERKQHLQNIDPRKIFRFEALVKLTHQEFDFAVLELSRHEIPDVHFPPPLTSFCQMQFPSEVHLIGHPGGVQMMEDSEVFPRIVEQNNDVDRYISDLSNWSVQYFPDKKDHYAELRLPPRKILFHTTFDKGSSGSPGVIIKNHKPCVVLMVRGGAPGCFYEKKFPGHPVEDHKRVEYGYAMEDIYKEMVCSTNQNVRQLSSEIFREWL